MIILRGIHSLFRDIQDTLSVFPSADHFCVVIVIAYLQVERPEIVIEKVDVRDGKVILAGRINIIKRHLVYKACDKVLLRYLEIPLRFYVICGYTFGRRFDVIEACHVHLGHTDKIRIRIFGYVKRIICEVIALCCVEGDVLGLRFFRLGCFFLYFLQDDLFIRGFRFFKLIFRYRAFLSSIYI